MSRASGASFAQFFPTAPRAAKDKAKEREKVKSQHLDSPSLHSVADIKGLNPSESCADNPASFLPPGEGHINSQEPAPPIAEDNESMQGDLLNGVGSASSHTSAVSSVFSAPLRQSTSTGTSSHLNSLTPLTNADSSPTRVVSPRHPKQHVQPIVPKEMDPDKGITTAPQPATTVAAMIPRDPRIHIRDPSKAVRGTICTYDPLLDRTLTSNEKKKAKAVYKDFGLEDDAPPADPRLSKGGRLAYINVDFHKPRSRLRHSPYLLKPYTYDPKTSIGSGPPTQVLVSGYDPLFNFANLSSYFSSFGDIAESSNKLHPDTGSCLGFGTFRYKDSKIIKGARFVSAIEAAKRAVRVGSGHRMGVTNIKVEFDPDGIKSRRRLEAVIQTQKVAPIIQAPKPPTAPKPKESIPWNPPTAPKGPAAMRPAMRQMIVPTGPASPLIPTKPRVLTLIEDQPISAQLTNQPYLFVSRDTVPVLPTTIVHMKKRIRQFYYEDVRADHSGYYITFPASAQGRIELERLYRGVNMTPFFTYEMVLKRYPNGTSGSHRNLSNSHAVSSEQQRSQSVERRPLEERDKKDEEARRKEEEADFEEEKRERAKNFDPAREAIEVVKRELKEQLFRNFKSKIAAPMLHDFLDPANHVAKRRKLNISDPTDIKLALIRDEPGDESPFIGTPDSRADSLDNRGNGRLNVKALPRIRKIKKGKKQTVGFTDPFARARPQKINRVRSLHHRLIHSEDDDSESDNETRSRVQDTEEPDSRSRSRITSEDEASDTESDIVSRRRKLREESTDTRDEDSMSEATFPSGERILPSKKRKLDLQMEVALKRQKKSDEELFGVAADKIEREFPLADTSMHEDTPMRDTSGMADSEAGDSDATRMAKKKAAKSAKRRKSKKQLFEEREALKMQQQKIVDSIMDDAPDASDDEDNESEFIKEILPVETSVEWGRSRPTPQPTITDQLENINDVAGLKTFAIDSEDMEALAAYAAGMGIQSELNETITTFAWKQEDVKALNRNEYRGPVTSDTTVEGYYVPNQSGCARTEGTYKILNSEKSKYLPHRIKVQKAREERVANAKREGKDVMTEAAEAAKIAAENLAAKGNSRANRVNNRRFVADLNDQKKVFGADPDLLKFNQLKKRKKLVKFARSAIHNWGLYAMENIPMNDMIIEYVGEKVRQQVADLRETRYLKSGIGSSYLFRIDDNTVVDATKKGGIARFINHSCMPNCTAKIITVEKSKRIVIYALRDIAQNEELTYDYKFEREIGATDRIPCLCGTAACKGFLN
ncbi:SET domain-containing protein [Phlyctema vagabunda]|uniref:Histone-lysine N-methyltransferase, H3 lysine-4 specific n=1 Tax=Phlyctema vagabunda TaxID=108571 RepID=A0ABR4P4I4_9HELO